MALAVTSLPAVIIQDAGLLLCNNQCALQLRHHVPVLDGRIGKLLQILLNHHHLTICLNRCTTVATLNHLQTSCCIFSRCH